MKKLYFYNNKIYTNDEEVIELVKKELYHFYIYPHIVAFEDVNFKVEYKTKEPSKEKYIKITVRYSKEEGFTIANKGVKQRTIKIIEAEGIN